MMPIEQPVLGLRILHGADAAVTARARELMVKHPHELDAWCVVVAPAKGLVGVAPDTIDERRFVVVSAPRVVLAAEFTRHGFDAIAGDVLRSQGAPGTYLAVVTCPEVTQLHTRELPPVRGVA